MSREDRKLRKHLEERAKRERRLAKKYSSQHRRDLTSRHTGPVATGGRCQHAGGPVTHGPAATGEGTGELAEALAGKLCFSAGHSGVGKSSLLNALDRRLDLITGGVSEGNDRGRHTTTGSALYHL